MEPEHKTIHKSLYLMIVVEPYNPSSALKPHLHAFFETANKEEHEDSEVAAIIDKLFHPNFQTRGRTDLKKEDYGKILTSFSGTGMTNLKQTFKVLDESHIEMRFDLCNKMGTGIAVANVATIEDGKIISIQPTKATWEPTLILYICIDD